MIFRDFKKFVVEFKTRPMPGKHVYVWNDDADSLLGMLGEDLAEELDLSSDIEIGTVVDETNEVVVRRNVEKKLERRLSELYAETQKRNKQQVLVVTSSSILARYKIGLTAFFSYYLGDHTMVILMVPKTKAVGDLNLPEYVKYDPNETLKYLSIVAQPENVIGGNEN
jgi:hypothetical protein